MLEVRLARRAAKDLDSLPKKTVKSIVSAIEKLAHNPSDLNLDIKTLVGRRPWRRLRVASYRVLFRLSEGQKVLLVARVVDRKELDQAVKSLPD